MTEKKDLTETKEDIKTIYTVFQAKHKIPSFESLNQDFDIDSIEPETKHLAREITKKIYDRIDLFKKILESNIQPEASILNMQEAEFLTEADHTTITDLLRRLMKLDRTLLLAELENDEALYINFINEAATEWQLIKKELRPIINRMLSGWSTKQKIKQLQHYLG